jgi:hypothetical protein
MIFSVAIWQIVNVDGVYLKDYCRRDANKIDFKKLTARND